MHLIEEENISTAWLKAKDFILSQSGKNYYNLIVSIKNPMQTEPVIHRQYTMFCENNDLTIPDKLSSTIFPKKYFVKAGQNRHKLYDKYPRLHKVLKGKWGSYFNQMINWKGNESSRNQLEYIINKINERRRVNRAAYTIQIADPMKHLGWPRGGPCLYSILIQLQNDPKIMSLLAVYRSHDFAVKAYGNYLGLSHLLEFLTSQTNYTIGKITCVSSHAFIESKYASDLNEITLLGAEHGQPV